MPDKTIRSFQNRSGIFYRILGTDTNENNSHQRKNQALPLAVAGVFIAEYHWQYYHRAGDNVSQDD